MKTKQHSQATTIENLKSETSWEFHALLIKQTECTAVIHTPQSLEKASKNSLKLISFHLATFLKFNLLVIVEYSWKYF